AGRRAGHPAGRFRAYLRPVLHHDARRPRLLDTGFERLRLHHVPARPPERHGDARHRHPDHRQPAGDRVPARARPSGAAGAAGRGDGLMRTPLRRVLDVVAVAIVAFWLLPVMWIGLTSIKPTTEINSAVPVFYSFTPTLEHYYALFDRFEFGRIIANNLLIVPPATVITILLSLLAAYALARMKLKGADSLSFFILSLRFMPPVVVVLPYYLMFQEVGLIDSYPGMILVYVAFGMPFAVWLLRSFLLDIPRDIEEAAQLDGLGRLAILWRIVIPVARP